MLLYNITNTIPTTANMNHPSDHAAPPGGGSNRRFAVLIAAGLLGLLLLATVLLRQAPESVAQRGVVASIPPLHSLVSGVMAGVATPELLLPGNTSPHSHTLRPSENELFHHAALVIWVDPEVESMLPRMLGLLADDVVQLQVGRLSGVTRLPLRSGGRWDQAHDEHAEEAAHAEAADADHGNGTDPHVWLDPENAVVWVEAIAARLATLDPEHGARYRDNAARLVTRLHALDAELRRRLAPVADVPYLVYHDAYRYLEARYGLSPAGSFTVAADRPVSAQRYAELRQLAREGGIRCLFVEPQFPPQQAERLAGETGIRIAPLDPLGSDLAPGPELYFTLLERLGDALVGCLGTG
jgi:zinc transport system substrate-binding protein